MRNHLLLLTVSIFVIKIAACQAVDKAPTIFEKLIFPLQSQHAHGSGMVALPNGDILATWYQGSGERTADDVKIMGARLKKGAREWSQPFLMADSYNLPDCNPIIFLNSKNKLFLVWIAVQAHRWEQSILRLRTAVSYDKEGAPAWNWQDNILLSPNDSFAVEAAAKFKQLVPTHHGTAAYGPGYDNMIVEASKDAVKRSTGWMPRIKPLRLNTGRILLPLYSDGFNFSLVAISDDDGETWRASKPIIGRGNVQPALAQRKDGHIVAYMRDNGDEPSRVQYSESADNGETWSPATKTDIPNEASVELLVLNDGRWAFVGNDEDDGRYRISLYLSNDEGKTWQWKKTLENEAKGKGSFSYPCIIQTKDNLLHITYSYSIENKGEAIKYVEIDSERIR